MSDIAIKLENLSKLYQLGEVGTGTLSKDLNRWWTKLRGKEDPYAKVGQVNDRTKKVESDFVWALKDINFEVKQGEVLGIIGKNGAGKSTLLKILSKITSPTTGKIYTKGRIASLLEVGTGFHPEMTGRENIYLNGAILGMRKFEIDKKFDEIVDFAGVEAYIDTPVKRYSSGMYVRLAFAVAAFLEPEILIVDEVLAVGDAEFQKRCLGRMKDVSVNDCRTVLFVSHNMQAVKKLTNKSVLLENGEIKFWGETLLAVEKYLAGNKSLNFKNFNTNSSVSQIVEINVLVDDVKIDINDEVNIEILYNCGFHGQKLSISIALYDSESNYVLNSPSITSETKWSENHHNQGFYCAKVQFPKGLFNVGVYSLTVMLIENGRRVIHEVRDQIFIEYVDLSNRINYFGYWGGVVRPKLNWDINVIY